MLNATFGPEPRRGFQVLFLGAHSDDIEIGCGGTVLELLRRYPKTRVHWVVLGAHGEREKEARRSASMFLRGARQATVEVVGFRDGFLPYTGKDVKEWFEGLKKRVEPDVIFTHQRHDLHQDHRLTNELTLNTFRDHMILEYEIIKYDGDLGTPNVFVPITKAQAKRKVSMAMKCFGSQRSKRWFTEDTLYAMLRIRGVECQSRTSYAEAFYGRKLVF